MIARTHAFLDALEAAGPAPDRGRNMDLYAWLVGSWQLDVIGYPANAPERRRPGEWHFGWVLEGRAIQDVWIVPARRARRPDDDLENTYYGTTLRVYDPRIDAWHVQWSDPISQTFFTMIGRRHGDAIVQDGNGEGGNLIRWSFSDITPQSFRWRGEVSGDDGKTWRLNSEFFARRVDPD